MNDQWTALVLNADMSPVTRYPLSVWSFERTMRNVFTERVTVVETYDINLRAQSHTYQPPSVVMLRNYVHQAQPVPFTRMNIFVRDSFRCQYCGNQFEARELTFDHVVPRSAGGLTSWTNIASACLACNSRKGHRRDMKPLNKPREPTSQEMVRARRLKVENLHRSWHDYLYWSGALERG